MFTGTRVPSATLFENFKDGATVQEFVEWFPGVEMSQAQEVLNHEIQSLSSKVNT